jgi:hypothetical protein
MAERLGTKYLSIPSQEHTLLIKIISGQQVTITSAAQPMFYSNTNAVNTEYSILYVPYMKKKCQCLCEQWTKI